jgi:AraC family transcriptional regulator
MEPKLQTCAEKKIIGVRISMTMAQNRTFELWQSFMPHKKEIRNAVGTDLISLQVYESPAYFEKFNPHTSFEKWAAIEVSDFSFVPSGMETFVLPAGLYAVFLYKGSISDAAPFFQKLFGDWLPSSGYALDNRPHFELLGTKYKNNDPNSEEEIWIPVKSIK